MVLSDSEQMETPFDELCDQALKHYEEISNEAMHSSSLVPEAIKFFKEHYVRRAERQFLNTKGKLEEALEEGWTFDPWLNSRGSPIIIFEGEYYWVLVKGTPDQIEALNPFVELPEDEPDGPEDVMDPYGLKTIFLSYNEDKEPPEGYVVMHKDHIYAKGTVYTLPPKPVTAWSLAIQLAGISGYLGVDEAHDVITGVLKKNA